MCWLIGGVKFLVPTGLTSDQVQYKINGDTASFTTADVESLGSYCKLSNANSIPLGSLVRRQTWDDSGNGSLSNITYLNGYYYYYQSPQSTCSNSRTDLQTQDMAKIRNLLFGILVN